MELRSHALQVLALCEPQAKCDALAPWQARLRDAALPAHDACAAAGPGWRLDTQVRLQPPAGLPGRPPLPRLVPPQQVPRRSPHTPAGRAALLHAVAHIEFNAVNLALDAVWRFDALPAAYYLDWMRVAVEEAHHFSLVAAHLRTLGHAYGDFDAHDGLWAMCEKTAGDLTARMALVPRTLEARGLDATPPMRERLARAGDAAAAAILDIILRDEVGHVAVGNHWYRWCCRREGLDPLAHHAVLAARHGAPRPKGPFNLDARRRAGFDEAELRALAAGADDAPAR